VSKTNFLMEAATDSTAGDPSNECKATNNVSGLLNMSKQRACKLEVEPILDHYPAVANEDQALSFF